jgi:hypothetical protein
MSQNNEYINDFGVSVHDVYMGFNVGNNGTSMGFRTSEESQEATEELLPYIIHRFKFTDTLMDELNTFAKIHQYDDRPDFKDAWKEWIESNSELIQSEQIRLCDLGFRGDLLTKMYKSARYYFRKKSEQKVEPKQRRQYVSVNKELLAAMDQHIKANIHLENYQPKLGFQTFCADSHDILQETITKIADAGLSNKTDIANKIKKTYKNRYFMITSKKATNLLPTNNNEVN